VSAGLGGKGISSCRRLTEGKSARGILERVLFEPGVEKSISEGARGRKAKIRNSFLEGKHDHKKSAHVPGEGI